MPAKPMYFHRLQEAIEVFQAMNSDWVDRRMMEEALCVSKTVAWRVLRSCGGADGPGNTLVCRRESVIECLTRMRATGEVEREIRRRNSVSTYLERLAKLGRAKRTQIATDRKAEALMSSRFASLPPGVEFTPTRLTVTFSTPEEFLERIGAVIFALQNDYDSVRDFIESGNH